MKNLTDLKIEKQNKVDALITASLMFFAFSNEQFDENKTPLQDGDKYVSIGMGGYLPKSKVNDWIKGLEDISKWFKAETKTQKLRKQNIAHELANHEAFYTCDISDTLDALGSDYTEEEVMEVYIKERNKRWRKEAA